MYARYEKDFLSVNPDYLSILIGINDVWLGIELNEGTPPDKFAELYDEMLTRIENDMPQTKVMILEPFVLEGTATANNENFPHKWEDFSKQVPVYRDMVKTAAYKHNVLFVPLQEAFDKASAGTDNSLWLSDGVHPAPYGRELIKREWLKAFNLL